MTAHTFTPASPKQTAFIADLLNKRVVPAEMVTAIQSAASQGDYSTRIASGFITTLLGMPVKPAAPAAPIPAQIADRDQIAAHLADLPSSYFALINSDIAPAMSSTFNLQNDLTFLQVKKYRVRGGHYVPRLVRIHGSGYGGFRRSRIASDKDVLTLLKFIAIDPEQHSLRFGEHFGVCGKCGANLTDQVSRDAKMGPDCRKMYAAIRRTRIAPVAKP